MLREAILVVVIILGLVSALPAQATRKTVDPAKAAETTARLLSEAKELLAAGDFVSARARFLDLLDVEPKHVQALHGVALAHLALADRAKAIEAIEKSVTLLEGANKKKLDRPLLMNFAMVQISNRNGMRAAKYLLDYLKANPEPIDETVVNALGAALNIAPDSARSGVLWNNAVKTYEEINAKLEQQKPGQKRWGTRWVSAAEFRALDAKWAEVGDALARKNQAWSDYGNARKYRNWLSGQRTMGLASMADIARADNNVRATLAAARAADKLYIEKRDTIPGPDFPKQLVAAALDEVKAPTTTLAAVTLDDTKPLVSMRTTGRSTPTPVIKPPPPKPAAEDAPAPALAETLAPTIVVAKQPGKRTVTRNAAAFPIAPGLFITAADAVQNAREIELTDLEGTSHACKLVRADAALGLALVRADGVKLPPVKLAADFKGGAVRCATFIPISIFDTKADYIAGNLKLAADGAVLSLNKDPRRPGGPLVAGKEVVGVSIADRSANLADLPVATLKQLRDFVGSDAPAAGGMFAEPTAVLCELRARVDVN